MSSLRSRFRQGGDESLGYTETLTYGHYTHTNLRLFAHKEARRLKTSRVSDASSSLIPACIVCTGRCQWWCHLLFSRNIQDWTFLTLLGFMVALLSFSMDVMIDIFLHIQRSLYRLTSFSVYVQYLTWILFSLVLICFSTGFTHIVGPTAIGSGIPEVKTIMKGVVLKEYLTFRTLVAKIIGLTASLGSGLPLGKVGPFVHVASVSASVLSKLFTTFRNDLENEARSISLLTAAAAVGVSSTFAAPIGGVLFSIEATAIYFAVRNYWRGFYSAMCGALMFRFLAIWFQDQETLTALFKTNLRHEVPFDTFEMAAFLFVGVLSGVLGALFVYTHKNIVLFIRGHKKLSSFLQRNRFIYPSLVTITVASCLFPAGFGQYMAGGLSLREAVNQMFDNRTWTSPSEPLNLEEAEMLSVWKGPWDNVLLTLLLYFLNRFWMCAISTTLPVPCGIFIPAFGLGAGLGRLVGEVMAVFLPTGVRGNLIVPGAYAMVGAATFSGAVTHTVSPAIIVFELTGQMGHVLPCVLAVMIANAVAHFLQPSLYDAMIVIKKLPYLPHSIDPEACNAHQVCVKDFMVRDLHCLTVDSTYNDAFILIEEYGFRVYPLVDNKESMMLLGAVRRSEIERILDERLSDNSRLVYFDQEAIVATPSVLRRRFNVPTVSAPVLPESRKNSDSVARFSVTRIQDDNTNVDCRRKSSTGSQFHPHSMFEPMKEIIIEKPQQQSVKFMETENNNRKISCNPLDMTINQSFDLTDMEWEHRQMNQTINFDDWVIDQAPFQIMDQTTLYKIHSLFSLLNLHQTFVTNSGRIVGIVSQSEVRRSIQGEVNRPSNAAPSNVPVEDDKQVEDEEETKEVLVNTNNTRG